LVLGLAGVAGVTGDAGDTGLALYNGLLLL